MDSTAMDITRGVGALLNSCTPQFQFVLQFDEEVIAWTCNNLQKICQTVSNTAKKKKKKLKNSNIKASKRPKNIKESDDSLFRNYWNIYIYIYIWLNNREI